MGVSYVRKEGTTFDGIFHSAIVLLVFNAKVIKKAFSSKFISLVFQKFSNFNHLFFQKISKFISLIDKCNHLQSNPFHVC